MRSALLTLALAAPLAGALAGCTGEPDDCDDCLTPDSSPDLGPDGGPEVPGEPACLDAPPAVDLLLVIDDSGSMCEEQAAVGAAFDAMQTALEGHDWRLAVVTTDMHPDNRWRATFGKPSALPVPSLNCVDADGQPAVPDTVDCEAEGSPVLDPGPLDKATAARRFRCMVNVGTQGDGFEKPLAAAAHALDCEGPNADLLGPCAGDDAPFLRPGAALVVVYMGDEDDCSDGAVPEDDPQMADCVYDDPPGDPGGAPCRIPRSTGDACVWMADQLTPVGHFVDGLRRANPTAAGVTALTLAGPRFAPVDGQPVRFVPGARDPACEAEPVSPACCPDGLCRGETAPVCAGPLGEAFAGNRLRAMAEAFPGEGLGVSICEADAPAGLADRLSLKLELALPPPCDPVD